MTRAMRTRGREIQRRLSEALVELIREACEIEEGTREQVLKGEARVSPMFELVRILKSNDRFFVMDREEALELVDQILRQELEAIADEEGTDDPWYCYFSGYDDPQTSFRRAWEVVKFPAGTWERAVALARKRPIELLAGARHCSAKNLQFLSICWWLQRLAPNDPIIISVSRFAQELGVSSRMISDYKQLAGQDGYLVLAENASFGNHRAAKFWFRLPEK